MGIMGIMGFAIFSSEPKNVSGAPLPLRPNAPDLAPRRKNPNQSQITIAQYQLNEPPMNSSKSCTYLFWAAVDAVLDGAAGAGVEHLQVKLRRRGARAGPGLLFLQNSRRQFELGV